MASAQTSSGYGEVTAIRSAPNRCRKPPDIDTMAATITRTRQPRSTARTQRGTGTDVEERSETDEAIPLQNFISWPCIASYVVSGFSRTLEFLHSVVGAELARPFRQTRTWLPALAGWVPCRRGTYQPDRLRQGYGGPPKL